MPPPPHCSFASDNAAGALPEVVEAIVAANRGHALAYGDDPWTARFEVELAELFGGEARGFLVWNGTGANVLALASMLRPGEAVVCTEWSHIAVDEAGAPERILGAKLIPQPSPDGKLTVDSLHQLEHLCSSEHHAHPAVVSITQSTELGAVYTPEEIAALCSTAHDLGWYVHLDGARLANAAAALGGTRAELRACTTEAGVDVVSFGGTKNGLMGGEAVVYLRPELGLRAKSLRKMVNQLPSKMRFVAAQFSALLAEDRWLASAAHANAMAQRLYAAVKDIPGVEIDAAPQVNSIFPRLAKEAIRALQEWCFFWDWDVSRHQVRWMTSWDTSEEDIDRFAAGVRHLLC